MIKLSQGIRRPLMRILPAALLASAAIAAAILLNLSSGTPEPSQELAREPDLLYGIPYEDYEMEENVILPGQTVTHMLSGYGISGAAVENLVRESGPLFDTRQVRAGNRYFLFYTRDSLETRLHYMVYERSVRDYVRYRFLDGDSVEVALGSKELTLKRRRVGASISSSLWNCIVQNDLPLTLSGSLEDVFGWTVDFFALQKEDSFTVVYDEEYVDTLRVGVGQVWGAYFRHGGKDIYAIPYAQDSVKVSFWDQDGTSLRKQLLKAPLKYSRVSSRFSSGRMHPILKTVRAHYGVDYSAPSGTPVVAIADGVITQKGWTSGGGNTVGIRHANSLSSTYMHLRGYASGLAVGSRVSQGDLIGYVGSTGLSTGPHLDFRLYKGRTPIDPLKAPSEPVEPIREEHADAFGAVRERVMTELGGTEMPDSLRVRLPDLFPAGSSVLDSQGDDLKGVKAEPGN